MENETVLKVLLVDDEPLICQGVARVIENFFVEIPETNTRISFATTQVNTGEEVFEKLSQMQFDLIFLDYKLPGIDGLEVLNGIKNLKLDLLVVMMTAYASLETAVKATKLGAFDFLAKPFSPEELRYVTRKTASQIILSRNARKHEEEKKKIRFEFLSVLSHELKSPLNAIEGYLDILLERTQNEEKQMLERCVLRLDGMRRLIFDLLDLTRIESGAKKREIQAINVINIINNSVENVSREVANKGIKINFDSKQELTFNADYNEIEIIANNLISNAVKYNKENGEVTISVKKEGEELNFSVTDSGIGISIEEQKKLFQEFVRIRNEKTAKILGSGLGLSTVKKLAQLYQGNIFVESNPGTGSTFTVILKECSAL